MSPSTKEERRHEDKATTWERHGQSIMASLVLAGIISVSINQNTTSNAITEINGKFELLEYKISSLQTQIASAQLGNFSRVEANAEMARFNDKYNELDKRVSTLENNTRGK